MRSGDLAAIEPRLLTKAEVAVYLCCEVAHLDDLVAELIPAGQDWRGNLRWDKHAIDAALDERSGLHICADTRRPVPMSQDSPVSPSSKRPGKAKGSKGFTRDELAQRFERGDALSAEMLARWWECTPAHVRRLCRSGDLQCFRPGGKLIRITGKAVKEFEARRETEGRGV